MLDENNKLDEDTRNLRSSLSKLQMSEKRKDDLIAFLEQKDKYTYEILVTNQSTLLDLENSNSDKQRMIDEMRQRISELGTEVNNKNDEINNFRQQISGLKLVIVDKDKIIVTNRQRILELENKEIDTEKVIETKCKLIYDLENRVTDKKNIINEKLNRIADLESKLTEKEVLIKEKEDRILEMELSIKEYSKDTEAKLQNLHSENETNELLDQIDLLKRRNEQLDIEIAKLKKEKDGLIGKLANLENTISIKDGRINDLEKTLGIKPIIVEETQVGSEPTLLPFGESDTDSTKRTIDTVVDIETGEEVYANVFFNQPESAVFKMRSELQKAIYLNHPKYICKYCGQMVKISGRKTERGIASFFSHLRDSDDCDYKTTTGRTKREIEREKYSKCNEGERHKKLKELLATFLLRTRGVTNVRTENTMPGNHPILNWRRPDVAVSYRGQEIIFELQLSSTFVSVITERDLFYRLNKKFIIWVFNFDDQSEHVNLNNMVVKDVYYNHKLNIFIFDKSAYDESNIRGELILKCNWIRPDGSWEYPNINNSDELGGRFVSLSELTYSNDYKPYYYDAEKEYFANNPSFAQRIISIEEENKKIIEDLDKRLQEEEEALHDFNKRLEELKDAFEIDLEIKHTQRYLIGRQDGKVGLITIEGDVKIPFEFDSVDARRNWIEAKNNNSIVIYSKNNYERINEGLKYESIGDNIFRIAKYEGDDILWGLMDKRGENIVEAKYSQIIVWNAEKQLLLVVKNGKYGIMNQHGIYVLKCKYDFIGHMDSDGYADITLEGKTGRIDSDCHFLEEISIAVGNSYMKVSLMGKWGIEKTDTKEYVVDCKYDELGSYRGNLLGIKDASIQLFNVSFLDDCPVRVKLVGKNDRGMLIFRVGSKEALMNLRQQQKARKTNLNPNEATEMYISFVNLERDLLYLSATPVKGPVSKKEVVVNDSDIALGTIVEGSVVHTHKNYIIIRSENEQTAYIHHSTWGDYSITEFNKGQRVRVEKIGFDDKHNKHVWKLLSVS